ncbi:septation protein A [Andreprevotia chitinilytica]|uniref:septation protein A n=1 Tax=Andreprevotia chitinilytica TaxID=396808 RepID=UPI0005583CF6|nr:septation protein A [Andreprevotia chitinilytica]
MKFLFDLLSVLLFFGAYLVTRDLFIATGVAMVTSTLQVLFSWWRWRKVDATLWLSFAMIIVLGGATLLLHDKTFIKVKPTALYWAFTLVLTGAYYLRGKNLIKSLMGQHIALPEVVWFRLNWAWALFFAVLGALNLVIAFHFDEALWVKFKLFGTMGLTLLFVLAQSLYLSRHIEATPEQNKETE